MLVYKYNGDGTWILCPRDWSDITRIRRFTSDIRPVTFVQYSDGIFLLVLLSCPIYWSAVLHLSSGYLFTVSHLKITSCSTSRHFRLAIPDGHWNVNEKGHRKSQFRIQYTSDVWKLLKLRKPSGESKGNLDSGRFRNKSWPTDAIYVALLVNDLMRNSTNFIGLMIVGSNNSFNHKPHLFQAKKIVDSRR